MTTCQAIFERNPPQENEATFQEGLYKDSLQNGGVDFGYSPI